MLEVLYVMTAFRKLRLLVPLFCVAVILIGLTWKSQYLLAILFGIFAQGLVEYVMHRFLFHIKPSEKQSQFNEQYRSHIGHHEFPHNVEFFTGGGNGVFEVKLGLGLVAFYSIILLPFIGWQNALTLSAVSVFVGHLTGFFFYEYCHTLAHLKVKKGWFGLMVTRSHLAHHFQDHTANFHVTPIAAWTDWVFGTPLNRELAQKRLNRETLLSLGLDPKDVRLIIARKTFDLPAQPRLK